MLNSKIPNKPNNTPHIYQHSSKQHKQQQIYISNLLTKIKTLSQTNLQLNIQFQQLQITTDNKLKQAHLKHQKQYKQIKQLYGKQIQILKAKVQHYQHINEKYHEQYKLLKRQIVNKEEIMLRLNQKIGEYQEKYMDMDGSVNNDNSKCNNNKQDSKTYRKLHQQNQQLKTTIQSLQHSNNKKQSQISSLTQQSQQLSHKLSLISKQSSSKQTELNYYKDQNNQYKQQLQQTKNKLQTLKKQINTRIQQQNCKWWNINENLLERIKVMESNCQVNQNKQKEKYQEYQKIKQMLQKQKQCNKDCLMEIGWYKQLLEEAKGTFLSNQLTKQCITTRIQQERNNLAKQNRKLKGQLKDKQNIHHTTTISNKNSTTRSKNYTTNMKGNNHNKSMLSKSPMNHHNHSSIVSVADFDKEILNMKNSRTPDKNTINGGVRNKIKIKDTPKK